MTKSTDDRTPARAPDTHRERVEEIARLIDSDIWRARDRAFSGEPFTPWDAAMDAGLTGPSLAKADAILSALPELQPISEWIDPTIGEQMLRAGNELVGGEHGDLATLLQNGSAALLWVGAEKRAAERTRERWEQIAAEKAADCRRALAKLSDAEKALERLGSMAAFTVARTIKPEQDAELLARIDFAREVLHQLKGEG